MPTIPAAEGRVSKRKFWMLLLLLPLLWFFWPQQIREDARYVDGGGCSVACYGLRVNEQCLTIQPPDAQKMTPSDLEYASYQICSSICFGQTERRPGCPEPE